MLFLCFWCVPRACAEQGEHWGGGGGVCMSISNRATLERLGCMRQFGFVQQRCELCAPCRLLSGELVHTVCTGFCLPAPIARGAGVVAVYFSH